MNAREYAAADLAELAGSSCALDAIERMLEEDDTDACVKSLRNSLLELRDLPHPERSSLGFARSMYGFMVPERFDGLPPEIHAAGQQKGAEVAANCLTALSQEGVALDDAVKTFRSALIDLNTDCIHPGPAFIGFSKKFAPMVVGLMAQYRLHERASAK